MARGKAAEQGEIIERQIQALDLRKTGKSYRAIGDALGISYTQAHRDVMTELKRLARLRRDKAEELRQLELERLDAYEEALHTGAAAGDPKAILAVVKLMERRAKLTGLDAPEQFEDVTKMTDEELERIVKNKGGG